MISASSVQSLTVPEIPFEVPIVSVVGDGGMKPCYVLTSCVLIWTG